MNEENKNMPMDDNKGYGFAGSFGVLALMTAVIIVAALLVKKFLF